MMMSVDVEGGRGSSVSSEIIQIPDSIQEILFLTDLSMMLHLMYKCAKIGFMLSK